MGRRTIKKWPESGKGGDSARHRGLPPDPGAKRGQTPGPALEDPGGAKGNYWQTPGSMEDPGGAKGNYWQTPGSTLSGRELNPGLLRDRQGY